jgi:hypothetical protein
MPTYVAMAHISRPFQIVVAVFLVFACVWLFALQKHSSTATSSSSAPVVSATTPAASAPSKAASSASSATAKGKPRGTSSHVYHGPVPGLEGLTRDISRAHHAVGVSGEAAPSSPSADPAASTKTAASGSSAGARSTTQTHAHSTAAASAPSTKATSHASTKPSSKTSTSTTHRSSNVAPATLAGQRTVEAELAKGDVVLLLFWNPKGVEDMSVHRALQQVARAERGAHPRVAVQEALAGQVASYGSVTRGVQVYATPTLFVINKKGQAIVLTGVQDAFSIEQSIVEAAQS